MKPFSAVTSAPRRTLSAPSGFLFGSKILTLDGELPVEFLSIGDRVITRDSGMAILQDVIAHEATCEMVSIMAGTLGHERPDEDALLPAHQKVLLRDWRAEALSGKPQALVTAGDLVDGEFIRPAGRHAARLFELVFDAPHILYVSGLELACEPQGFTLSKAA